MAGSHSISITIFKDNENNVTDRRAVLYFERGLGKGPEAMSGISMMETEELCLNDPDAAVEAMRVNLGLVKNSGDTEFAEYALVVANFYENIYCGKRFPQEDAIKDLQCGTKAASLMSIVAANGEMPLPAKIFQRDIVKKDLVPVG